MARRPGTLFMYLLRGFVIFKLRNTMPPTRNATQCPPVMTNVDVVPHPPIKKGFTYVYDFWEFSKHLYMNNDKIESIFRRHKTSMCSILIALSICIFAVLDVLIIYRYLKGHTMVELPSYAGLILYAILLVVFLTKVC